MISVQITKTVSNFTLAMFLRFRYVIISLKNFRSVNFLLEKLFKLKENNTNVRTEVLAGCTTFLTMAYILAVNPNILGVVMDSGAVFTATAIASAVATFLMAFFANYPIALSAGMGLNAYFAYTVCFVDLADASVEPFTIALTAILVEGIVFILLSLFKFRETLVNLIPQNLKYGISAGIGLFIALIGFQGAGIVVSDSSTVVAMGDMGSPEFALCMVGIILIAVLSHFNIKGAILWGILGTWILGMCAQGIGWYVVDIEAEVYSLIPTITASSFIPPSLAPTFMKFDFSWAISHLPHFLAIVFAFLFVDLFDTVGTVVAVADKANLLDEKGNLPRVGRVFMADSIGTVVGSMLGTSTITSFVESSSGVAVGGKTGLTSATTGVLFLVALFLSPIFLAIPGFATAPALIVVGMLMLSSVTKMSFSGDWADSIAGYLAVAMMPLTYSISNGIMFGILSWIIIKVLTGKVKDIHPFMYFVGALFVIKIITAVM